MAKKQTYGELKQRLEELMDKLDSSDIDMDEAIKVHAEAQAALKQLDKFISEAELKIEKATD